MKNNNALLVAALLVVGAGLLLSPLLIRTLLFQPYTIPSATMEPTLHEGDYIVVSKNAYGYSRHSIIGSPPLFKGRVGFHAPARGDIVVFKLPRDGQTDYIKRLIGLPGDRIQLRHGRIYINGKAVPEHVEGVIKTRDRSDGLGNPSDETATVQTETTPEGRNYRIQVHGPDEPASNTAVYTVPARCYFLLGDNRDNSLDSRFGPGLDPKEPKLGGCGWDGRVDSNLPATQPGVGFVPEINLVGRLWLVVRGGPRGSFRIETVR